MGGLGKGLGADMGEGRAVSAEIAVVRGRILSAAELRAAVTSERMADRRTNWPTSSLNVDNTVKSTVRRVGGSRGGTGRRRWKLPGRTVRRSPNINPRCFWGPERPKHHQ